MAGKRINISVWVNANNLEEAEALGLDVPKIIEDAIVREVENRRAEKDKS